MFFNGVIPFSSCLEEQSRFEVAGIHFQPKHESSPQLMSHLRFCRKHELKATKHLVAHDLNHSSSATTHHHNLLSIPASTLPSTPPFSSSTKFPDIATPLCHVSGPQLSKDHSNSASVIDGLILLLGIALFYNGYKLIFGHAFHWMIWLCLLVIENALLFCLLVASPPWCGNLIFATGFYVMMWCCWSTYVALHAWLQREDEPYLRFPQAESVTDVEPIPRAGDVRLCPVQEVADFPPTLIPIPESIPTPTPTRRFHIDPATLEEHLKSSNQDRVTYEQSWNSCFTSLPLSPLLSQLQTQRSAKEHAEKQHLIRQICNVSGYDYKRFWSCFPPEHQPEPLTDPLKQPLLFLYAALFSILISRFMQQLRDADMELYLPPYMRIPSCRSRSSAALIELGWESNAYRRIFKELEGAERAAGRRP